MDAGLTVRPTTQPASVRLDVAVRDAVPASLSAARSVSAVAKTTQARAEDSTNARKIILDAQSREVMYRVLDADLGRAYRQTEEEARLRSRAYARASSRRMLSKKSQPEFDVEA
jgi:hypothetical protein